MTLHALFSGKRVRSRLLANARRGTVPRPCRLRLEALEDRYVPATFTVTTNSDIGGGSLRQAILQAEAGTGGDTINFAPSLIGQTISPATPLPTLTKGETITGLGPTALTVAGNNTFRIFTANSPTMVTISGLTITGGNSGAAADGGGVLNNGLLTLNNDVITINTVPGAALSGGGVASSGAAAQLTVTNCTVANNSAFDGGGIGVVSGSATITGATITNNRGTAGGEGAGVSNQGTTSIANSTIAGNEILGAGSTGGGIENIGSGVLTVTGSTVVGNTSQERGAGIRNAGTSAAIINCTIVNNVVLSGTGGGISSSAGALTVDDSTVTGNTDVSTAATNAGGISFTGGAFTLNNTIVADNFTANGVQPNVFGAVTAGSGNLIGAGDAGLTGITNGTNGNQVGTIAAPINPLLGPLQNNGGTTLTRNPLAGSPVIDRGVNAAIGGGVTTDQRGFHRIVNNTVDIGAVEFQPATSTTSLTVTPNPSTFGQAVTYTAHVAGTAANSNTPTGTVTFMSGTTTLGTATVDSNGNAILTTANVPRGSNSVTATYSGDSNFNSSISSPVTQKVNLQYTPGVFDPATGTWYLRNSNSPGAADAGQFQYGAPGWIPVVGDWNGDGTITIGVVDPATMTWYLRNENSPGAPDVAAPFQFGTPGWVPVAGDWGGSGTWGIGAFDPSTGTWYLRNEANAGAPDAATPFQFGGPGWIPVVGDWDGNGSFTVGAVNPNGPGGNLQWFLRNSNNSGTPDFTPFTYGLSGWKPVTGDWTGQGFTTIGVVDPSTNTWYLRNSNSAGTPDITPFSYGAPGWTPVTGDWIRPAAATTTAAVSRSVTSSLAANPLVTGLRRTQALDQVFSSGNLGGA
jgi:hypothetical protein